MAKSISPAQLRKLRAEFIDQKQDDLIGEAAFLQDSLYSAVVDKFLDLFETDKGVITFNNKNIKASEAINKIFDQFNSNQMKSFLTKYVNDVSEITDMNIKYHRTMADDIAKFRTISDRVTDIMYYRLGVDKKGRFIKDGFLDSFIKDNSLRNAMKQQVLSAVTKQVSTRDLLKTLKENIKGTEANKGSIEIRLKKNIYDTYQQYDRTMSREFATDLNLRAFIYGGVRLDSSRDFCIKKKGKVFTTDEAERWVDDPDLPKTKDERKSGKVTNYDPLTDLGRWGCIDHINYISKAEAIRLRPDLEGKL